MKEFFNPVCVPFWVIWLMCTLLGTFIGIVLANLLIKLKR